MKKLLGIVLAVLLGLLLLALPAAVRWLYYYDGTPAPRQVPRPDLSAIAAPTPPMPAFVDAGQPGKPGTVLVDRAHDNNVQMAELNLLKSRLAARGQRIEMVESTDDLAGQLRHATALLVISPREDWAADDVLAVRQFVDEGGRLLLVADATRYEFLYDDYGEFLGLDHDAAHLNDLAGAFGLVFQSDYLYNTAEYESNFRNIKLSRFGTNPLTAGLTETIFYATRSILSEEPALIEATGATRSSSGERSSGLAVAVLADEGRVLALGDLTFLTEPHNAVADNDRLGSNVADWLSGAERRYDLAEFPSFFRDDVDLLFAGDPLLDSDLLAGSGALQATFEENGKQLVVRQDEDQARDALFLGLYDQAQELEPYLADAQVTLWITPTEEEEGDSGAEGNDSAETGSYVEIQSFGQVVITGTSLLVLERQGERQVLLLLANTQAGVGDAVQRLIDGDLSDCVLRAAEAPSPSQLALCPTGEVKPGEGEGGWNEPDAAPEKSPDKTEAPPTSTGEPKGSVLILSFDEGTGRYDSLTGAEEFAAILEPDYKVTLWSKKDDGLPGADVIADNDLVIFASGDFPDAFGQQESSLLLGIMLAGTPTILSGAYLGQTDDQSVIRDIRVSEADHPITRGFESQAVAFVRAPSGAEVQAELLSADADAAAVPFVRGPESEDPGAAAVMVVQETASGIRTVLMGFPIYLLPEEARSQLVLNTVEWLLAPGEALGRPTRKAS